jgi:hypothetical protein
MACHRYFTSNYFPSVIYKDTIDRLEINAEG